MSSCSENSEGHVSESSLSEKSLTGDYVEEKCNSVNSESQQESVKFQEELEKSNEAIVEAETILPTAESSEDISPAAVAPGNGEDEGCLPVVDPVEPPSLADNGSRVTGIVPYPFSPPHFANTFRCRCAI